jgi:chromosome segregation ATPase
MAAIIPITGLNAEEQPAPAIDLEARQASIANLETHISQREARLAEWGKDIVELDARIEKRVDELVKMLAGLRDSQDSRTKVTQIKKEAIEGLKRGIDLYVRKRREVRELVRTGDTAALGDLGKFDVRIIKRVDQIADLTKSIPTHEDVDKYESDGGSYWNGYYYENSRTSDEWKQNRRDTQQSDKQRKDTTKALRETLDRLDQRRRSLTDLLANRNLTAAERTLYTSELGQVDAYQDHLKAQLRDVASGTSGGGQAVGRDQAHDIEELIDDARKDLREDVARLFRSYDQFARGRAYLEELKANLASRKEWLEKNLPAKTEGQ